MQKIKSPPILVFSDDFGEHPSSCQHIFHHLPPDIKVLWVNTIGMRNPEFTRRDFQKALLKLRKMSYSLFSESVNPKPETAIQVCQPPMLPFANIPGVSALNRFFVSGVVRRRLKDLGMPSPVMVTTVPNAHEYIGLFDEKKVVYYCVDDFSEWPGLDKKLVQRDEKKLIGKADEFIATSQNLYEKLSRAGKDAHLLTHGVDYNFLQKMPSQEHPLLKDIPRPRVGYFGLFDRRSNLDLLHDLAVQLPQISFVITGNIEVNISELQKLDNLFFTGSIPYEDLPAMAMGYDICMLPYKINKLTNAIQPLKIKEYIATGKPVISTPIKETGQLREYLQVAETVEEWKNYIFSNINGINESERKKRELFLQGESWELKAEKFFNICFDRVI